MTSATASAIGRTLSRLGRLQQSDTPHAHGTREQVRRVIADADGPVTIEHICRSTGLHANTVRPHLEVLLAVGSVSRERGETSGRGRPPWRYRALETRQERERRRLTAELSRQLDDADAVPAAAAASRWARHQGRAAQPAASIDEAVTGAAEQLSDIGFEVDVAPTGDRIDLMACPFAALVAERPVICLIHAELLQHLLDDSGQPVELERLDVFPRPGVCTAFLRRPDRRPVRSITRSAE